MHHQVKNNFQIIASLINLQKRMLPPERRGEVRFIEEHVQSMAVVYRIAHPTTDAARVPVNRLVREVLDSLRQIAGRAREILRLDLPQAESLIGQEQAVALALYLAVLVPPNLDSIASRGGELQISVVAEPDGWMTLSVAVGWDAVAMEPLRLRLASAYLRQLKADPHQADAPAGVHIRFRLCPSDADPPR